MTTTISANGGPEHAGLGVTVPRDQRPTFGGENQQRQIDAETDA
jgi:hypothetical protein